LWTPIDGTPGGGSIWTGVIPNPLDRQEGPSAVYLPPGFSSLIRYPVLYLLHGLPGAPSSYFDSLRLRTMLDELIASRQVVPMIVVMPQGPKLETDEWAGPWESYLVHDVVPWVDAHLPTIPRAPARVLGGLCAGGYGAMDIGLRNPTLFGALESWEGYFAPVFRDGPFVTATKTLLEANNPTLLVQRDVMQLRHDQIRFYVSVGGNHAAVRRVWSLEFASLLTRLRLPHTLWQLPPSERGHFWQATLPSALEFASAAVVQPAV
jgi:enterochelin esterase-like enzyme